MAVTVWSSPIQGVIGLPVVYGHATGVSRDATGLSVLDGDVVIAVWGAAMYQRADIA